MSSTPGHPVTLGKTLSSTATNNEVKLPGQTPVRRLTPAQIEEYRRKNLCFKCDEPFTLGHKCKSKLLMLIESEDADENAREEEGEEENMWEAPEQSENREPEISLHAMDGSPSPRTIRLLGLVNRNQ